MKALALPEVEPTHDDCVWAAGYFDGEGTVGIGIVTNHAARRYVMVVKVSSTVVVTLEFLRQRWGGCVRKTNRSPGMNPNQKDVYTWQLSANMALRFLEAVSQFLKLKREVARVGRIFQMFSPNHALRVRWGHGSGKQPGQLAEIRSKLKAQVNILNKRGRLPAVA